MCFGTAVVMVRVNVLNQFDMDAGKIVTGAMRGTSRVRLMAELGWEDMKTRRAIHKLICYLKIVNNLSPSYLKDSLPPRLESVRELN